jgi:hypothetical protein
MDTPANKHDAKVAFHSLFVNEDGSQKQNAFEKNKPNAIQSMTIQEAAQLVELYKTDSAIRQLIDQERSKLFPARSK